MMEIEKICSCARNASYKLASCKSEEKNKILLSIADGIEEQRESIKKANAVDIANAKGVLSEAMIDRLTLTDERIDLWRKG